MSDVTIKRSLRILLWVLFGVTLILAGIYVYNIQGSESQEALKAAAQPLLYWTYCLIGCAAVLAVVFPVLYVVQNPRKAVKALVSLAILAVIVGIAYALSSSEPLDTGTRIISDPTVLRWSGTGINTTFILAGIAILLLIVTGIQGLFRK